MKTRIIRIGNSQGVRIPKPIVEQAGLTGEVELSVRGRCLVIKAAALPRAGWAAAFRAMAQRGDDALIDEGAPVLTGWDEDERQW
jgi:antitoxin MazE